MPIYEYVCQDCEKTFETIRPMSQSNTPIPCAICGGEHTKRKLSVFFAEAAGKPFRACPSRAAMDAAAAIADIAGIENY